MQTLTSAATSVNKAKLPAVFRKASLPHQLVLDYGCGKYTDHIREYIRAMHKVYIPFDPFNQPDDVNRTSAAYIVNAMHAHFPVDVICSNVLNVIDDDETVRRIARNIEDVVSTTGGIGYVTVYEGDRSGIGRQTGRDQYQRNAPLRDYLRFFHKATISQGMIIVKGGN